MLFFRKKKKENEQDELLNGDAADLPESSATGSAEPAENGSEDAGAGASVDNGSTDGATAKSRDADGNCACEAEAPEESFETTEDAGSDEAEVPEESFEATENADADEAEVPEESFEAKEDAGADEAEAGTKKKGFFARLVAGMSKTRSNLAEGLRSIFGGSKIDEDFYEELEEILIMADIGVATTGDILEGLRAKVKEQRIKEPAECRQLLMDTIREQMAVPEDAYAYAEKPSVIMMVGVNGVGKTTTAGKIAGSLKADGKRVLLAAADTFRAAATEQLTEWAHRAGCEIISAKEGADPAAVVFDAVNAAKARRTDVLICDTAGRLHNKKNLMDELGKINRVISREYPEAHRETFVVLDATTGQNALVQAREFNEIADITGIVITKMDGTAKGGIVIAIQKELGIPVKYIGVGEKLEDMQRFDPDAYVEALFEADER